MTAERTTMPQLDGLRAVAVLLVLVQHYAPPVAWLRRLGPGGLGVSAFFVLSGFLITGILLDVRPDTGPRAPTLRAFYARRVLRIFPLYYAVLFAMAALDLAPVRRTFGWHLAYLSNYYFLQRGSWDGPVTPLWSLALEEQFYLAWPLAVLALSPRALRSLTVALLLASPLLRLLYLLFLRPTDFTLPLLPLGNTDPLFAGALLAQCWRTPALATTQRALGRAGVYAGLPLLVGALLLPDPSVRSVPWFLLRMVHVSATALLGFAVVDRVARGLPGALGALLQSRALLYVGKRSYGIYLLHVVVHYVAYGLCQLPGLRALRPAMDWLRGSEWRWFPVACATALLAASASWRVLEEPLNGLKRLFPYPRREALRTGSCYPS